MENRIETLHWLVTGTTTFQIHKSQTHPPVGWYDLRGQWNLASFLVAFWPRHQAICVSLPFKQMTVDVASLGSAHLLPGRSWAQTSLEKHWFCNPCLGFYTGLTTCFPDNDTTTHRITKKDSGFFPVNSFVFAFFQVTNEEVHVLVDKTAPCWAEFPTSPRRSEFVTTRCDISKAFFNGKNLRKPHGSSGFQDLPVGMEKKTRWKSHPLFLQPKIPSN